jgi:hypothetical protein
MGAFAVAFILISGYTYVSKSTFQKYITRREDGHRYYFRCGAYGILFSLVGVLIAVVLDALNLPSALLYHFDTSIEQLTHITKLAKTLQDYLSIKLLLGSCLAIFLAYIAALVENFFRDDDKSRKSIHATKSPPLEKFLFECGSKLQTILITLGNRKVYVGLVNDIPIESGDVEHFTILPILSGYRDKDTLSVIFTVNYYQHYEKHLAEDGSPLDGEGACFDDFIEIIPVSEIAHIGSFDIETYKKFITPIENSLPWMQPMSYTVDNYDVVGFKNKSDT